MSSYEFLYERVDEMWGFVLWTVTHSCVQTRMC